MDKIIEQIFRIFNHLAREIQVYIFSGFVIAINTFAIDYFFYRSSLFHFIKENSLIIPGIIVIYLLGHFALSFYLVILELGRFDKSIDKKLGFDYNLDPRKYPGIFVKHKDIYTHFIERYILLALMRWTISAACCINVLINIVFIIAMPYKWQFFLVTICFALGMIGFYILTARTEKENAERITAIEQLEQNDQSPLNNTLLTGEVSVKFNKTDA